MTTTIVLRVNNWGICIVSRLHERNIFRLPLLSGRPCYNSGCCNVVHLHETHKNLHYELAYRILQDDDTFRAEDDIFLLRVVVMVIDSD